MTVNVPSYAVKWIKAASIGSGLPYNLVACQVNAESGFQQYVTSSAGAEGPYQFLPSTFFSVWHGSPFSWQDSTIAYGIYMSQLLRQFHGNVRDALAAYNAGPANIAAGFGYADGIILCSGSAVVTGGIPGLTSGYVAPAPAPSVQPDDWSWWINQSARWINELGGTCRSYAHAIGRL